MTQPNQSELEKELREFAYTPPDAKHAPLELFAVADLVAYITANYTPNATVEQLKSRIAWLEGKVEGLTQ